LQPPDELNKLFQTRWREVSGEYVSLNAETDLRQSIANFLTENNLHSAALAGSPLPLEIGEYLRDKIEITVDFEREKPSRQEAVLKCSRAEVGITTVDALIADTGTLVLRSRQRGDRLCSLLPEIHLAIALKAPIFPNLAAFFETAPQNLSLSLITGPSRTADIEKQLVLGAHGPRRVVVWGQ